MENNDGYTKTNYNYLYSGLETLIGTVLSSEVTSSDITLSQYSSTTQVPSKEIEMINELTSMTQNLYRKFLIDVAAIRLAGEKTEEMDEGLESEAAQIEIKNTPYYYSKPKDKQGNNDETIHNLSNNNIPSNNDNTSNVDIHNLNYYTKPKIIKIKEGI